ncbi:MAG TPA: hypothetical protein VD815_08495 [Candidatus Saccharimonadales bacterium]|nr:hypothetical protein [Candidatus Saccharimonadales bacterium]
MSVHAIKNDHALTIIMSEKPLNKKDNLQRDVGDAADNENVVDEIGDSMEPGPREMTNKKKDTNSLNIDTELDLENSK